MTFQSKGNYVLLSSSAKFLVATKGCVIRHPVQDVLKIELYHPFCQTYCKLWKDTKEQYT